MSEFVLQFNLVFLSLSLQLSLWVCIPADAELVLGPRNRAGCGRKSIRHKNNLGCMGGLTLAVVSVIVFSSRIGTDVHCQCRLLCVHWVT